MAYQIDKNYCGSCGQCFDECTNDAIIVEEDEENPGYQLYTIIEDDCLECGACAEVCPNNAIDIVEELED